MIKYISTRGGGNPQTFEQVLLSGLAPDGGLYVPETWPQIKLGDLKGKSYVEIAQIVMFPFVEGSISQDDFSKILHETYNSKTFRSGDIVPLRPISNQARGNITVMEQFHGPTIAFKDIALQLLGRLFDHVLKKRNEKITIVGATSGDTGSAAIEGCKNCDNISIFILHPKGRVSDVQRKQMTTIDAPNVHNIAIEGSFDDCQNMVKAMFNDEEFRNAVNLSAVNSINWARIMAQIVYYFTTALKLGVPEKEISFVVPTGNFGNIYAAYAAQNMGLPIKRLCVSTNKNDILTRFLESGEMKIAQSHATISPSMDIQISSNFERYLFDLLGRDAKRLDSLMREFKATGQFKIDENLLNKARNKFCASRADDEETLRLIRECYEQDNYILDPHTAVGLKGARLLSNRNNSGNDSSNDNEVIVLLATAHPAKFPDAVEKAIGIRPDLPEHLSDLFERKEIMQNQPNNLGKVMDYVRTHTNI